MIWIIPISDRTVLQFSKNFSLYSSFSNWTWEAVCQEVLGLFPSAFSSLQRLNSILWTSAKVAHGLDFQTLPISSSDSWITPSRLPREWDGRWSVNTFLISQKSNSKCPYIRENNSEEIPRYGNFNLAHSSVNNVKDTCTFLFSHNHFQSAGFAQRVTKWLLQF